jgi:DNA-binding NarL/FixJ family response regulator
MQNLPPIPVHLMHADPVVNIGLKVLCDSIRGLNFCVDDNYPSREMSPAILVSDYRGGMELARQFRYFEVRVLIITHYDKECEIRQAMQTGIHGYVLHNCILNDLQPAIAALSNGFRYLSARANLTIANSWNRPELTGREAEVLQSLSKGHCNKLIARELGIYESTVKTHLKNVMSKLSVSDRMQAVIVANQRGLLTY